MISWITLCWNKPELIMGFIHSFERAIRGSESDCELIIVDNGSTDPDQRELVTKPFLRSWVERQSKYRRFLFDLPENKGFGEGNNIGLSEAQGEHVCFVNNDVQWIDNPNLAFSRSYNAGSLMGPRLLNWDTGWNILGSSKPHYVPYLEGWCLFMDRDTLHKLWWRAPSEDLHSGLFDSESFPLAYFEDVDVSLRALLNKIPLQCEPTLPVRHLGSQTSQRTKGFEFMKVARENQQRFRAKWSHLSGYEWGA